MQVSLPLHVQIIMEVMRTKEPSYTFQKTGVSHVYMEMAVVKVHSFQLAMAAHTKVNGGEAMMAKHLVVMALLLNSVFGKINKGTSQDRIKIV
jgi:hypothetical protein